MFFLHVIYHFSFGFKSFLALNGKSVCFLGYLDLFSCCTGSRTTDTQWDLFSKFSKFWVWADILDWNFMRHLGYFRPDYQHPFWYCEFFVHVFHCSTNIFIKKMSLYFLFLFFLTDVTHYWVFGCPSAYWYILIHINSETLPIT